MIRLYLITTGIMDGNQPGEAVAQVECRGLLECMPSSSLLAAGAVELVLGLAGLGLLLRQRAGH